MSSTEGPDTELVWYVAYGSNLHQPRFQAYLSGTAVPLTDEREEGAADPTPPREARPVVLDRRLTFGRSALRWDGGGVCFLDPEPSGAMTLGVAYLVTLGQFADVERQESHLGATPPLSLADLPGPHDDPVLVAEHGWYRAVVGLPPIEGRPAVTFTSPEPEVGPRPASIEYLTVVALGLRSHHDLGPAESARYLAAAPGCGWDEPTLAQALAATLGRHTS